MCGTFYTIVYFILASKLGIYISWYQVLLHTILASICVSFAEVPGYVPRRLARAEATDRNNPLRASRCCLWAESNMAANAMETDDLGHLPSNTLRRSNSAPNVSAAVMSEAIPIFQPIHSARQRRFSTSQMALNAVSKNSANKCQRTLTYSLGLISWL